MSESGTSNELDQSPAAGALLVRSVARQLRAQDLDTIVATQRDSLSRFEKTNEMLANCNTLSVTRLTAAVKELQPYRQMLTEMKRDLDGIFRRIRTYKQNFSQQYPEAFAAAQQAVAPRADNEDDINGEESEEVDGVETAHSSKRDP